MTMKMRLKMKNRSQIYDINRPRPRHGHKYTKYKMCISIISNTLATFEAQFMKKLSNTEAELKKKALLIKISVYVKKCFNYKVDNLNHKIV